MQAQTMQVRRTLRVPWLAMLVVALLVAALAIGVGITTSHENTTTIAPAVPAWSIGPSVRFGAAGEPGAVTSGPHGPNQVPKGTGSGEVVGAPELVTAANGKPLT